MVKLEEILEFKKKLAHLLANYWVTSKYRFDDHDYDWWFNFYMNNWYVERMIEECETRGLKYEEDKE